MSSFLLTALIAILVLMVAFFVGLAKVKKRRERELAVEASARQAFPSSAKQFTGYYQALRDCVDGKGGLSAEKLLRIWEQRMEKESAVCEYYALLRKKHADDHGLCAALLEFAESCGIVCDGMDDFEINEQSRWVYLFDDVYEYGDIAEVVRPAWYFRDGDGLVCIEKGAARLRE